MRILPMGPMGPMGMIVVACIACGSSTPPGSTSPELAKEPPPATAGTRPQPFQDPYPSMVECIKVWTLKRAEYDKLWGASHDDNGAASWKSPATNELIELACNPVDQSVDGPAEMTLRYSPADPT